MSERYTELVGTGAEQRLKKPAWGYTWRGTTVAVSAFWVILNGHNLKTDQADRSDFDRKALSAQGVVIKMHSKSMSGVGGRQTSDPEVRFQTKDGKTVTFIDTSAVDLGVSVGASVTVRYMPERPDYAKIDNAAQDTNSTMMTGMFIVFIGIGIIGAALSLRSLVRYIALPSRLGLRDGGRRARARSAASDSSTRSRSW